MFHTTFQHIFSWILDVTISNVNHIIQFNELKKMSSEFAKYFYVKIVIFLLSVLKIGSMTFESSILSFNITFLPQATVQKALKRMNCVCARDRKLIAYINA